MTIAEKLRKEGMEQGVRKGLLEGIEVALDIKFGQVGLQLMDKINTITKIETLEEIKELIRTMDELEMIERKVMKY